MALLDKAPSLDAVEMLEHVRGINHRHRPVAIRDTFPRVRILDVVPATVVYVGEIAVVEQAQDLQGTCRQPRPPDQDRRGIVVVVPSWRRRLAAADIDANSHPDGPPTTTLIPRAKCRLSAALRQPMASPAFVGYRIGACESATRSHKL